MVKNRYSIALNYLELAALGPPGKAVTSTQVPIYKLSGVKAIKAGNGYGS